MENYFNSREKEHIQPETHSKEHVDYGLASAFLRQVYTTMVIGLVITGVTAWFVNAQGLVEVLFANTILRWVIMLAPLGFVFFLAARINKMSFTNASITFAIYSFINGVSFSVIFYLFDIGALSKVFFITAGTFGAMAIVGLTTKIDLSKFGSILLMALIGLIIAMVVNWFMESSTLDYIISGAGVLIFSGLTAYDNQMLMRIGLQVDPEGENGKKMALMGALNLYLDFVNLFLFLLRFFGGGDD